MRRLCFVPVISEVWPVTAAANGCRRSDLLQVYTLKLLKMQTKYMGRQWRKSNMRTVSAIYQKVRHRLVDDWAFGNGEPPGGAGTETRHVPRIPSVQLGRDVIALILI